jgi:hypothetical protein
MAKIIYTYTDEECETYYQIVSLFLIFLYLYRGRILGRNWDKSLSFLPFTVTSSNGFYPPPPKKKKWLKLVCNVNIVYGNLRSEIMSRNLNEIVRS